MAKKDGKYIEFSDHELYDKIAHQRIDEIQDVVSEVDAEMAREGRMTEEQIELEKKADMANTELQKNKFINEMKSGLGVKIKEKPMDIKVVKKKRTLGQIIKEFFSKF